MRKTINNLFFGKNSGFSALAALALLSFIVLGCNLGRKTSNQVVSDTNTNSSSSTPVPVETPRKPTYTKADASKSEIPSDSEMQDLTRTALLDFNSAVQKGDFSDFHSKISKTWQKQTTPEDFNNSFSVFITKKINISNVASTDATFSSTPALEPGKTKKLVADGCYDVSPRPVKFNLKWIPEGKDWKLFGIEVDTTVSSCS